jgi:hypothetical protein
MQRHFKIFALFVVFASFTQAIQAQPIKWSEFTAYTDDIPGELIWERVINIGPGVRKKAVAIISNKGNGALEIGNVFLKNVDCHDDGCTYQPSLLHTEFEDVTGDGFKDIIVHGTVRFTEDEDKLEEHPTFGAICMIVAYEPRKDRFRLMYWSLPDKIALETIWLKPMWDVTTRKTLHNPRSRRYRK